LGTKTSINPRTVRVQKALMQTLRELIQDVQYEKITISQICKQAGVARHTFYNHYQTKDDLLNAVLDSVLFRNNELPNIAEEYRKDPAKLTQFNIMLFKSWRDNRDLADFVQSADIEAVLALRFRDQLMNTFFRSELDTISPARLPLSEYMITLHAHAYVGVLMKWLREGMVYPPEVMGEFLHHFIGIEQKQAAIGKFKELIT
jgi:AcrR family transcriptional regulator